MTTLRNVTYVVKMDTGDGTVKAKDFRLTLQTMEQSADKASATVNKLAKTIGEKYGTDVSVAVDQTRQVKNEITQAARESARAERNFSNLSSEYRLLASRTGRTAEEQEKLNALYRLGAGATLTQKKELVKQIDAYQRLRRETHKTQGSMRALRGQAQNFGYQMQDVAVQLQAGTDALVVFGQQGSQLAAGFGAKGALIGAVIAVSAAVGGTLVKALGDSGSEIDNLVEKMNEFAKAMGITQEQAEFLISIERKEAEETSKNITKRSEKIAKLNAERLEYEKLLSTKAEGFFLDRKGGTNLVGEFKTRETLVKKLTETKTELAKLIALNQTEIGINRERSIKMQEYVDAIGMGTDESKRLRKENEKLVESIEQQASVIGLSRVELLQLNRAQAISTLETNKATDAQIEATNAAYDRLIADAKLTEAQKGIAAAAREEQKRLALEARLTDQGRLNQLERRYETERELLKGNTQALLALENEYNDERLKIEGSFWEKFALSAQENILDFDSLVTSSVENFTEGFGNAFANAIFETETLGDAMKTLFVDIGKSMVAFFAEWAAQKLLIWTLDQTIGRAAQTSAAATTLANAQAGSYLSAINAYQSAAAIPFVGWQLAPAAATSALAITQPLAAAAGSAAFAGTFDKGGLIPSGMTGIVSEYGDELVGGTMVYNGSPNSLKVTGREDTARMMNNTTKNNITVNSYGNASPEAIARSIQRLSKRRNKRLDTAIYDSTNRGATNRGKRYA